MNNTEKKSMLTTLLSTVLILFALGYAVARGVYCAVYFEAGTRFTAFEAPTTAMTVAAIIYLVAGCVCSFTFVRSRDINCSELSTNSTRVFEGLLAVAFVYATFTGISAEPKMPVGAMDNVIKVAGYVGLASAAISAIFYGLNAYSGKKRLTNGRMVLAIFPSIWFATILLSEFVRSSSYVNRMGRNFTMIALSIGALYLIYEARGYLKPEEKAESDESKPKSDAEATVNARLYTAAAFATAFMCLADSVGYFAVKGTGETLFVGGMEIAVVEMLVAILAGIRAALVFSRSAK